MIHLTIAGKPSPKLRARIGKLADGRPVAYTPTSTRKYETHIRLAAQQVMGETPPLDCAVEVRVVAYIAMPKRWSKKKKAAAAVGDLRPITLPDLDQYTKIAWDGLKSIVFVDDKQVVDSSESKFYDERPRLEIFVREVRPPGEPAPAPLDRQVEMEV